MNGDTIQSNHGAENVVRLPGKFRKVHKWYRIHEKSLFICLFPFFFCSNETSESDDETNISQEILVLDFGDEKNEFLRSGGAGESDYNGGKFN